ncbi:unnamed protein product [Heterosigma akashiwo]
MAEGGGVGCCSSGGAGAVAGAVVDVVGLTLNSSKVAVFFSSQRVGPLPFWGELERLQRQRCQSCIALDMLHVGHQKVKYNFCLQCAAGVLEPAAALVGAAFCSCFPRSL